MAVKPTSPVLNTGDSRATGLLAWWLLHEGSGTAVADLSPNGLDGVASDDTGWDSDGEVGPFWQNNAVSSPYIEIANNALFNAIWDDPWAISILVRSDFSSPVSYGAFFGGRDGGTAGVGVHAYTSTNKVVGKMWTTSGSQGEDNVHTPAVGRPGWARYVVMFDGSDMIVYEDGVHRYTKAVPGTVGTLAAALRIGDIAGHTLYDDEHGVGDVRLWTRVLTAAEIAKEVRGHAEEWTLGEGVVDVPTNVTAQRAGTNVTVGWTR